MRLCNQHSNNWNGRLGRRPDCWFVHFIYVRLVMICSLFRDSGFRFKMLPFIKYSIVFGVLSVAIAGPLYEVDKRVEVYSLVSSSVNHQISHISLWSQDLFIDKEAITQESDLRALLVRPENFSGRRWTRKGSRMVT